MIVSLNQIEQTARKAARGGGLAWGLADEAGKAVRWLHIYGLNGAAALADWLARRRCETQTLAPQSLAGVWRAPGGMLDPLLTGAALSDCIEESAIETGAIAHPLLAAGFIAHLADIEDLAFAMEWTQVRLCCARGGVWIAGEQSAIETAGAEFLRCQPLPPAHNFDGQHHPPQNGEVTLDDAVWKRLDDYARRTLVEATDASRLAGAGAGLRDND